MAKEYVDARVELGKKYIEEATAAIKKENAYKDFLNVAVRFYALPFKNQLLIYRQRPDATLVQSYEDWKKPPYYCYVKKGSSSILLSSVDGMGFTRKKNVFDVTDVESKLDSPIPKPIVVTNDIRDEVLTKLENRYSVNQVTDIQERIHHIILGYMDKHDEDFMNEYETLSKETHIELPKDDLVALCQNTLEYEAYQALGLQAEENIHFQTLLDNFADQNENALRVLGILVNQSSRVLLQRIEQDCKEISMSRASQLSVAKAKKEVYNEGRKHLTNKREEGEENDRNREQNDGSRSNENREMGNSQSSIHGETSTRNITDDGREGRASEPSSDNSEFSSEDRSTDDEFVNETSRNHRTNEGNKLPSIHPEPADVTTTDGGMDHERNHQSVTYRYYAMDGPIQFSSLPLQTSLPINFVAFETKTYVDEIRGNAFGYVEYNQQATDEQLSRAGYQAVVPLQQEQDNNEVSSEEDTDASMEEAQETENINNPVANYIESTESATDQNQSNEETIDEVVTLPKDIIDYDKYIGFHYDNNGKSYVVHGIDESKNEIYIRNVEDQLSFFHVEQLDTYFNDVILPNFEKYQILNNDIYEPEQNENNEEEINSSNRVVETVVPRDYRIVRDSLGTGRNVDKFNRNIAAIQTLQFIESENRNATEEEQEVLAQYVGWGGLADAFDPSKPEWKNRYDQLKSTLSEDEYTSARASVLDSFYTQPIISKAIYTGIAQFGFKGGNVLEPAMGIGNFFGTMPEELMDHSRLYGIELDSISGRIAKQLYPSAKIKITGYEKTKFSDNFFDVAVGNVPFGDFGVSDIRYNKYGFAIHDYFFAKTIDKVRTGGVIAFVTSRYTMDKKQENVRKYIAERCDLIGAVRLPNTAFKANAGTEITSDLLFLQKRERPAVEIPDWVHTTDYYKYEIYDDVHTKVELRERLLKDLKDPLVAKNVAQRLYDALSKNDPSKEDYELGDILNHLKSGYLDETKEQEEVTTELIEAAFQSGYGSRSYQVLSERTYTNGEYDFLSGLKMIDEYRKIQSSDQNTHGNSIYFIDYYEEKINRYMNEIVQYSTDALSTEQNNVKVNNYFLQNPEHVLGHLDIVTGPFGYQLTCNETNESLENLLAEAIKTFQATIPELEVHVDEKDGEQESEYLPATDKLRNYSYGMYEDTLYYRVDSVMRPVHASEDVMARIQSMVGIRDTVEQLLTAETNNLSDDKITSLRAQLNTQYNSFTELYGRINDDMNKKLFETDNKAPLVRSLEMCDEDGKFLKLSAIFIQRTINPRIQVTHVSTAMEALGISIGKTAGVDLKFMSTLTDKEEADLIKDLHGIIFENPETDQWETADAYLSGNVRKKLEVAEAAYRKDSKYEINVQRLKDVLPPLVPAEDIKAQLGSTWIDVEYYQMFLFKLLDTPYSAYKYGRNPMKIMLSPISGEYRINKKSADNNNLLATTTYGTSRMNAYTIFENLLNLKEIRVTDTYVDEDGKKKTVLNIKETTAAQQKAEELKMKFAEWIFEDPERRNDLVTVYNNRFNSERERIYDGSNLELSGMTSAIALREHQKNAIARILYGGNTLLAHVVGAGKTYAMVASIMEAKHLGLCNKAMIVVPNHLVEQWGNDFLNLYPEANILVATKKDFEKNNRKIFCSRIATGNYDAIIIAQTQFSRIPLSAERQQINMQREKQDLLDAVEEVRLTENKGSFTVKQLEKKIKEIDVKIQKLFDENGKLKDDVVTFEQLGVDRLYVDEAHYYKNLFMYTKMSRVAGVQSSDSQRSFDMMQKVQYLNEKTNYKGVVFATGTPVSNSMTELYTMQRYLQMNSLKEKCIEHFDAWAATFGETQTSLELKAEGTGYQTKTRFSKFNNLPELMLTFKQIADIQTNDMIHLDIPEVEYENIVLEPSEEQKDYIQELANRADIVRTRNIDSSKDNMLKITNDGRKVALDQKLVNPEFGDNPNSKVNAVVNSVYDIYQKYDDTKATQLIFCDQSTPKRNSDKSSVYYQIKAQLVKLGVHPDEIQFMQMYKKDEEKKALFDKVNQGAVRVLIGSTNTMGAGTNVQEKLIALHHLDVPWKPADIEQQEGRIIRQGNENSKVFVKRYITKGTFDAYSWQIIENKQKFISQIMTSKSPVRSMDEVDESVLSAAEVKALATSNPYIKEKMDLDIKVSKYKMLKTAYTSNKYKLEDKIVKELPQKIESINERIKALKDDYAIIQETAKQPFEITLDGKTIHDEDKAIEILSQHRKLISELNQKEIFGDYHGFKVMYELDSFNRTRQLLIEKTCSHRISGAIGGHSLIEGFTALPDKVKQLITDNENRLEMENKNLATAKEEVKKPFIYESEYKQSIARLAELDLLLSDQNNSKIDDDRNKETKEKVNSGKFSISAVEDNKSKIDLSQVQGSVQSSQYRTTFAERK